MSRQTFIIIVIILVFGGAGLWFFYFQSSSSTQNSPTAEENVSSSNPDMQRIEQELVDLRRLKDLQLDTSILKNQFLQSLEALPVLHTSTSTPGRANPFLPF